jgi:phenylacetate-coenzyme A ligase PaaK-like adenylate-forming protein
MKRNTKDGYRPINRRFTLIPSISRNFLFYPTRTIRKEPIRQYFKYVRDVENLSLESLREFQWQKVQKMMRFAYAQIPYYRNLFNSQGMRPDDIKSPNDFRKLPILTKEKVRSHFSELKNPRKMRVDHRSTSGSTGLPMHFEKDRHATACLDAVEYHGYSWHGIEIGAPQARFWGVPTGLRAGLVTGLKDFLMNRVRVNAFRITDEDFYHYYKLFKRFHPAYFYGYPSLIYEFALFVRRKSLPTDFLKLKAVIGTSELANEKQIALIEEVFNTRFVAEYGCTEAGLIGLGCKKGNIHLMAHNIYLEVLDNGRQVIDKPGDFVITELNSRTFPFIRYHIGDRGILSTQGCGCGLQLPVIKVVLGRSGDSIKLRSGRKVNDNIFEYCMKGGDDSYIEAYRAIQVSIDTIELYLVVNDQFEKSQHDAFMSRLDQHLFNEVNFDVRFVDKLPRDPSGKVRFFVSKL